MKKKYFKNNKLSRMTFYDDCSGKMSCEHYYRNGLLHREDKPAYVRFKSGGDALWYEKWFINGQKHRVGGPAAIYYDRGHIIQEVWYQKGLLHRMGGPAFITYSDRGEVLYEAWHENGKRHRIDGPAVTERRFGVLDEIWYEDDNRLQTKTTRYTPNKIHTNEFGVVMDADE